MQKAKAATFKAVHYATVLMAAFFMGSLSGLACFCYGVAVADPITAYGFGTLGGSLIGIAAAQFAHLPFKKI